MRSSTKIKSAVGACAALIGLVIAVTANFPNVQAQPDHQSATAAPTATPIEPAPGDPAEAASYAEAAVEAAALPVIIDDPNAPVPQYQRDSFGTAWSDIDGNGCRQRDDVLARDLVDVVLDDNGCTVLSGVLVNDPYTGGDIVFQHDRVAEPGNPGSQGVQGEHIVSLKAAHVGGAWAWTDDRRLQFANDLDNVIAVDGIENQSKQDAGPSDWLPATWYRCTYVLKYTQIIDTWGLSVTVADRDALVQNLTTCGAES
ncbi:MAG TPA: HNH endonuclease [Microbacterium sp.]|nr:HNH endonuclease [Microbacterium sp.]